MPRKDLKLILSETKTSLDALNAAILIENGAELSADIKKLAFDGLVKRFEILFLQSAELMRIALTAEGVETNTPRGAIREAVRINWVTNPDFWLIALDARSQSINGLRDLARHEYINIATQFATEVEVILALLGELQR